MNKVLFLFIVAFQFWSCDENKVEPANELIGLWRLQSSCGGAAGCQNAAQDQGARLKITKTQMEWATGRASDKITYTLKQLVQANGSASYQITLDDGTALTASITNLNLEIKSGYQFSFYYQRVPGWWP